MANGQTTRYIYDGEDILLEYNGSNVLQARYTHGPGIDEPLSRTPMVPGLGSGQTAVLASTPDGLRGPVVDDGIKVNGQVSVGFVFVSGMPAPAIGQPIDSTGLEQPIAPIDVTAAAATGALAVDLIDTGGIGGNAPLYLVTRDQATNQVIESRLLFPARATFASTTPLGTPLVVASATVPTTTPVADGTLYYHQDGLGTVTELTDSSGAVAKAYAYDAYGNLLESPGTVEQPYTYTGREFDSEAGLYYYRARYYDSGMGRFLQKDPIGFVSGDLNLYGYVFNRPLTLKDPSGLVAVDFDCFKSNFGFAFDSTNDFFFGGLTGRSKTAVGTITSGAVARKTGFTSLGMAFRPLLSGQGVANLSVAGTIASVAANAVTNAAIATVALETGVVVGSALDAAVHTFIFGACPSSPCEE